MQVRSYAMGEWYFGGGDPDVLLNSYTGEKVAEVSSRGLDFKGMLEYARNTGGPNLRKMTFHQRAILLKNIAKYISEKKDILYELSYATGATKTDAWFDVDGGMGTFFTYSGKGRQELPDENFIVEGETEQISKNGTFVGRHILVPLEGAAVHINAYNFPCWGMMEKLAPTFLAGMPAIVKPASVTSFVAEKLVELIIESNLLPEGSLQLISGSIGDLFDHLTCQDVVTFTGSAVTGRKLKAHPKIIENSVRFNLEADSLNCSILAPDAVKGTDEFNAFIKELVREMTIKAGQRCTAIRRTIIPQKQVENVIGALKEKFSGIKAGNPADEEVKIGPLVSSSQAAEVRDRIMQLRNSSEVVIGNPDETDGSLLKPVVLYCLNPFNSSEAHEVEAFGPVNTIMPYNTIEEAIKLANLGKGSLVASLFTADNETAKKIVTGTAPYHGRILIVNRECVKESTGHGSPLPHLVHGGPGRAGGGEELGGVLGVKHFMQRTALQGSPSMLSYLCNRWMKGAAQYEDRIHPFRKYFEELRIGETLTTQHRTITEADVVNFAGVSGDFFYAHINDIAAKDSIFGKRVAHGYFLLSAAAGLFVSPAPGPVLANYGINNLRFIKPVFIGDSIYVKLICKQKTRKEKKEDEVRYGIVEWHVEIINQNDETVAIYSILTLVKTLNQDN